MGSIKTGDRGRPKEEGGHARFSVSLDKRASEAVRKAAMAHWKKSQLVERQVALLNPPLFLAIDRNYDIKGRKVWLTVYNFWEVGAKITAVRCDGELVGCLPEWAVLYNRDFDRKRDRHLLLGVEVLSNPIGPVFRHMESIVSFRLPKRSSPGSFVVKLYSFYAEATFRLEASGEQKRGIHFSSEAIVQFNELGYSIDGKGMPFLDATCKSVGR